MAPPLLTSQEALASPFDLSRSVFLPCWPRLHTGIQSDFLFSTNLVSAGNCLIYPGFPSPARSSTNNWPCLSLDLSLSPRQRVLAEEGHWLPSACQSGFCSPQGLTCLLPSEQPQFDPGAFPGLPVPGMCGQSLTKLWVGHFLNCFILFFLSPAS